MPAAGNKLTEESLLRLLLIEVRRLRVEFACEGLDLICGDGISAAVKFLPDRQVVQTRVEITPDSPPLMHTHPGEEVICVLEGMLEYQLDGQPNVVCAAGDALTVPSGLVHSVRNVGSGIAVELATYIVEKDKPVLTVVQ